MNICIEKAENGYILSGPASVFQSQKRVYAELHEVFAELLAVFEGRRESFNGDLYGTVAIFRVEQKGSGRQAFDTTSECIDELGHQEQ